MDDDAFHSGTLTDWAKGSVRLSRFLSAFVVVYLRFNCRPPFLRSDASFTGSAPQRYRIVSHTSEIVVSKPPRAPNRRDEETMGGRSVARVPRRESRRQKSISSNNGNSRKPPACSNALRRAKMPWSPKNQPSNRDRLSPIQHVSRNTGDALWKRRANPPPTTAGRSSALSICRSAFGLSQVSA